MFRKFPTLILILLSSGLFSQELVTKQKVNLEKFFTEKREAYPVINGNNVSLYLTDPNSISRLSFDLELNQQTIYTWRLPDGPYDLILGGRHTPTNEILFFSDNKRRKLGSIVFPADGASLLVKNIDLDLKNEAFIESFNHGDNFIMLTVIKQTNILRIYSFTNPVDYTVKDINFFDFRFDSGEQYLSDALTKGQSAHNFEFITYDQPHGINMVSAPNKLYVDDQNLVLTFDSKPNKTILLSINLSGFEWKIKEFSHPVITCGQFANPAKTNSFYLDKVLYQFYGCNGQFVLRGINSETDSIIKEYLGFKGVEVSFMNSPVIKEGESNVFPALIGGDFRRKEVEKMNGFYRNLGSGRLGVDVYSRKNELELMIGTFIETTGGGGAPMMMGQQSFTVRPPAYTGVGPQTIKVGPPTMTSAFQSYKVTQATYFKSRLEKNTLNHLEGPALPNAFDKMIEFMNEKGWEKKVECVFKIGNDFFLGYYFLGDYYIYRFID